MSLDGSTQTQAGAIPRLRAQQAVRATALLLKHEVHFRGSAKEALETKQGEAQTSA